MCIRDRGNILCSSWTASSDNRWRNDDGTLTRNTRQRNPLGTVVHGWLVLLLGVVTASAMAAVVGKGTTTAFSIGTVVGLSLIHISEPTRLLSISYAVFCLKKKKIHKHLYNNYIAMDTN
eukprot:TRINITY_DN56337_c0_g1_i2.p1 TRINITY_DN56337_c0_g1~~TRINITY_DN56337_c0_g1_i2.p1  ORF type:complete len:120 (+),score=14.33 TRINITY_DN56337_c0_g1_i2:151-510(+)